VRIVLIFIALIGLFYAYKYLNEKHMEEVKLKRTEGLKQMDHLEFNRSLYKVQAARQRIREQLQNKGKDAELKFNLPQDPESAKIQEQVQELKKEEPSIPTNPEDQEKYIDQNANQDQGTYQPETAAPEPSQQEQNQGNGLR
jgi:hypothetical protein